jgi:predicted transcriptional regulator
MARALRVDRRTVERWEAGDHPVPAGVLAELTEHLRQHHARIAALLDERRDGK